MSFKLLVIVHCVICIIADCILLSFTFDHHHIFYISTPVWKILIDNSTHAISASLCWISFLILQSEKKRETDRDRDKSTNGTISIVSGINDNSGDKHEFITEYVNDDIARSIPRLTGKLCILRKIKAFVTHNIREIMSSMAIGSLLDLDHFIAARSSSLFAATHLEKRPFGHNLFFLVISSLTIFILISKRFSLLFASSIFDHLSRDAIRRGYSFSPFFLYSSYKLPYVLYLTTFFLLPLFIVFLCEKYPFLGN